MTLILSSTAGKTIQSSFANQVTDNVHGYRYYNVGSKRVQSAWFTWDLPFNIEYAFVLDDELFVVRLTTVF